MDGSLFVLLLLSGLCWNSSGLSRPYQYINRAMSWSDAQSYCRWRYTDLATVDSMDDVNRLVNLVDAGYSGSVWIGLKRGTQKRWLWSNGENNTQYYNWASGEPDNDGDCGALYYWQDNSGYVPILNPKIWSDARSYCRENHIDLAPVHNLQEDEQKKQLIEPGWQHWFGLYADSWEWSDQWDLRFRYWAADQPSMTTDSCIGMSATDSGKWSQQSCDLQQPFFCHGNDKRKQIVRLKVTCNGECMLNDPTVQTAILNKISEKLKDMRLESNSTISWIKGEGEEVFHQEKNKGNTTERICVSIMDRSQFVLLLLSGLFWNSSGLSRPYHYINTAMTWSNAQSYCRERFTDLATVDSMDDVNRLINTVEARYSGSVWIGLTRGTQKRWLWSNGENTTQYYNWASGHPNGDGDCVVTYSGVWHTTQCIYGRYFVCFGNSGYILVQSVKSWSEAQSYCRQFYIDLPTIHNSEENNQIKQILLNGWQIWIGLFLDPWEWSDQWDLRFRHWAAGQPSMNTGACVGMSATDSGKWSQQHCDLQQPFICYGDDKRKKIVRLKVTCNGECTLNDPSLQTAILNEVVSA
ncbi:hypothetical protein QQF64_015545 [Cirrhinus molitorella]|uniref:C-type lectin domain-containing protein n=1 Tax=Cirrhinus molitorella TaxID=172907 RepID=A0ABR3NWR9_9TELE